MAEEQGKRTHKPEQTGLDVSSYSALLPRAAVQPQKKAGQQCLSLFFQKSSAESSHACFASKQRSRLVPSSSGVFLFTFR